MGSYLRWRTSVALAILVGVLFDYPNARAADVTSTLIGSGTWTTNGIWNSALFPNNGNGGLTYDVVVTGNDVTIPALTQIVIVSMSLNGGVISGSGTLTLSGASTWSGGWLAGPTSGIGQLTLGGTGPLTLSGGNKLFQGAVANSGNIIWQAGEVISAANDSTFANSGQIDLQGDGFSFRTSATGTLVNATGGTLRRSVGTGTSTIAMPVINSGTIDVDTGTLNLTGGGSSTGLIDVASGTTFGLSGGMFAFENGASSTGSGLVRIDAGTVNLNGATSFTNLQFANGMLNANGVAQVANLQIGGGVISGSGTLTLSGASTWSGGWLAGPTSGIGQLTFGGAGPLTISGGADKPFQGSVANSGTMIWQAGEIISVANGSTFTNSGLINLQGDGLNFRTSASGTFVNAAGGTLRRSVGTGTAIFTLPITNQGTIDVDTGILAIQGGGSSSGAIDVAAGAEINFTSGLFTFQNGASSTGAGLVRVAGGTVDLTGANSFSNLRVSSGALGANGNTQIANLQLTGGAIASSGTLILTGPGTWTGGLLNAPPAGMGQLTFGGAGPLTISGGADKPFQGSVANSGTMIWQAGEIISVANGSTFTNSGLINLQGDGLNFRTSASGTFVNAAGGTLRRSVSDNTAIITLPLTNNGTIDVQTGDLRLTAGLSNIDVPTTTLTGGTYRVADSGSGAAFVVQGAPAITTIATGTTVEFSGANPVMQFGTTELKASLANNAGTLRIRNGHIFTAAQPLTNTGTIELGAPGLAAGTLNTVNGVTNAASGQIIGHGPIEGSFVNNGSLSGNSSTEFLEINGTVSGSGSLKNVRIDDTHIVGLADATAIVSLEGSYLLNGNSVRLDMELNGLTPGVDHDQLSATGTTTLDGILDVSFIDADFSFNTSAGNRFTIITSTNPLVGAFDTINLPIGGGGSRLTWLPVDFSNPNEVVLEIATAIPYNADYDLDGDVDGRDFLVWQRGGSPSSLSKRDLMLWQQQYGNGALGATVAVPEPSAGILMVLGLMMGLRKRH